jgi:hypothetical protein
MFKTHQVLRTVNGYDANGVQVPANTRVVVIGEAKDGLPGYRVKVADPMFPGLKAQFVAQTGEVYRTFRGRPRKV